MASGGGPRDKIKSGGNKDNRAYFCINSLAPTPCKRQDPSRKRKELGRSPARNDRRAGVTPEHHGRHSPMPRLKSAAREHASDLEGSRRREASVYVAWAAGVC